MDICPKCLKAFHNPKRRVYCSKRCRVAAKSMKGRSPTTKSRSAVMAKKLATGEIDGTGWGKQGNYASTKSDSIERYSSSYELKRFQVLDESPEVKSWTKKHGIAIPYIKNGKFHRYVPDILVEYTDGTRALEEVKGYVRDEDVFEKKNAVAERYCEKNNITYRILRKDDLEKVR